MSLQKSSSTEVGEDHGVNETGSTPTRALDRALGKVVWCVRDAAAHHLVGIGFIAAVEVLPDHGFERLSRVMVSAFLSARQLHVAQGAEVGAYDAAGPDVNRAGH